MEIKLKTGCGSGSCASFAAEELMQKQTGNQPPLFSGYLSIATAEWLLQQIKLETALEYDPFFGSLKNM